ncbi:MAG: hypothetical protein ABL963_02760 [Longimicrobiales bacterium]
MSRSCVGIRHAPWTIGLIVVLAACASGARGGSGEGGSADLITREQIDQAALDSALDVIRRLRPRWLQPTRSPTGSGIVPLVGHPGMPQDGDAFIVNAVYATVIRDGLRLGEISSLASISPQTVASIRFLSAADASTRYGSGYDGGVIEVVSR